jgi:hypothetical protein
VGRSNHRPPQRRSPDDPLVSRPAFGDTGAVSCGRALCGGPPAGHRSLRVARYSSRITQSAVA